MRAHRVQRGFSLIELMIVLAIFSVVMAGLYSAYRVQLRQGVKEYRIAESEMEHGITRSIIERDLSMAGYGLAEDYDFDGNGTQNFSPNVASASNGTGEGDSDILILRGTAIGRGSKSAQGWTFITETVSAPTISVRSWNDSREDVQDGDRVIVMEPGMKKLLDQGNEWLFRYEGPPDNKLFAVSGGQAFSTPSMGNLIYGLYSGGSGAAATQPYYAVRYALGGERVSTCAPGTLSLLREESRVSDSPTGGDPILDCVLDFQVALGLDTATTDGSGPISTWDNGGVTVATWADHNEVRRRLKQIRVYALVQQGIFDSTYSSPTPIRVGDLSLVGGPVGRDKTISSTQLNYRWRVVSFVVTPRNSR